MSANCIGFCQNEPNLTFDRSDGGGPTMLARTGICAGPAAMAQPNPPQTSQGVWGRQMNRIGASHFPLCPRAPIAIDLNDSGK